MWCVQSPYSGCSPLHIAVLSSSAPMVEMVLSYGVDLYAKDEVCAPFQTLILYL